MHSSQFVEIYNVTEIYNYDRAECSKQRASRCSEEDKALIKEYEALSVADLKEKVCVSETSFCLTFARFQRWGLAEHKGAG